MGHYDCKYCDACPNEAHDDDCPRKVAMQADADLERITRERGQAVDELKKAREKISRLQGYIEDERAKRVAIERALSKRCTDYRTAKREGNRRADAAEAILRRVTAAFDEAKQHLVSIEGAGHEAT